MEKIILKQREAIILFFLFILIFILILGLAVHTSKIGIEVENLIIDTEKPKGEKINEESKIYVYLLIFQKIKLFKKNVKGMKLKNVKFQNKDIDVKYLKNRDIKINYKELIQNIEIEIKKVDLYMQIGTEDAALTAILVGIASGIVGVMLKKPKYQIVPIYTNKNLLKIKLDGIFTIYLMHYIYSQIFKRKRSVNKNERTSNRKSYDDCYE